MDLKRTNLNTVKITWADTEQGRDPTSTAIRTGKPSMIRDINNDPSFLPWRDEARKRGYASSLALPLTDKGKVFGTLNIYSVEKDTFSQPESKLLCELANDLSYRIISLRAKLERDIAERELAESEEKYRTLFENSYAMMQFF